MFLPRIVLIGPSGQVGRELQTTLARLGEVVSFPSSVVNLAAPESIRRCIRMVQPNVIVNAGAYTAVDNAEADSARCFQVNADAPGVIAHEAREIGAWVVHFSTDYVYDGAKSTPYVETDAANPLSVYGRSKLFGDLAVTESGARHLIFRLSWVYAASGRNFFLTMKRLAAEREVLSVVADQWGAPTWARLIAGVSTEALRQVINDRDGEQAAGIYHLAPGGETTWHGFAEEIVRSLPDHERRCREVRAIASHEYPVAARRPARSVLSTERLRNTFRLALPHWRQSFHEMQLTEQRLARIATETFSAIPAPI